MEETLKGFQPLTPRLSATAKVKELKGFENDYLHETKDSTYVKVKYVIEYLLVLVAVLFLLPVFLLVGLIIKMDSRGSVFFKQKRYGRSGRPFQIYKFRTMVEDAHRLQDEVMHLNEMKGGMLFKSDHDPRVTRVGKILRKFSIDELPQLFNILKGEMTIIGPRALSTPLPEYDGEDLIRFQLKPGLGCIWQAYFRGDTDFKSWMKTDAYYVKNVSAKLDIQLFFIILRNVLLAKGAR